MTQIIPAAKRAFNDFGWLKTFWLFSFDHYHDPNNMHFGNLRVFNDDKVAAQSGFPTHPHREMEIVTIILTGAITHQDSMGNKTAIRVGEIQRMTAGTGITHSEHNLENEELHLYQIWFMPRENRLKPSYEQKLFNVADRKNVLQPVVSGIGSGGAVLINSNATIFLSDLDSGKELTHPVAVGTGVFFYVTDGELSVNGNALQKNDQLRITDVNSLAISAKKDSKFILIDVEL